MAQAVSPDRLATARRDLAKRFTQVIPAGEVADRSIRLYLALGEIVRREGWEFYTLQSFPAVAMSTPRPASPRA